MDEGEDVGMGMPVFDLGFAAHGGGTSREGFGVDKRPGSGGASGGDFSLVMALEAQLEVCGMADVEVAGMGGLKDVDEVGHGLVLVTGDGGADETRTRDLRRDRPAF